MLLFANLALAPPPSFRFPKLILSLWWGSLAPWVHFSLSAFTISLCLSSPSPGPPCHDHSSLLRLHISISLVQMPNVRNIPNCPKACKNCRIRKVKCCGGNPCSNCLIHEKDCFYPPSLRGKRNHTKGRQSLEDRLAHMETLIQSSGLERVRPSSPLAPETTGVAHHFHSLSQPPENGLGVVPSPHSERRSQPSPRDLPPGNQSATTRSPQPLGPSLDAYPPLPPMYMSTPFSWDGPAEGHIPVPAPAPAPASSAFSLDGHSLGELDQSPGVNQDEYRLPTQTRIWEHHGECSYRTLLRGVLNYWRL